MGHPPPGRPLVTRRDRRAHASRTRILDAAIRCLVETGYARASTVQVQRRAQVSRGGLLHHFPSKEALLVAAAQHLAVTEVARAGAAAARFEAADGAPERVAEAVGAIWSRFQEIYSRAAVELWVAAAHDGRLRAALEPAERTLNAAIREAVAAMFGPVHAAHPNFPVLRDVLLTSMRGLLVADAFDGREARHRRHLDACVRLAGATLLHGG